MSLVELHRFATPIEAELARLRLNAEGIVSIVFDAETLYATVFTGVRLMVDEDDKDEAEKLLEL
ncbi:MAG TPA: DUF2007 domain-containing protein [Allosphingosinicella sp.]|nr:DUF2007 domain-containing protein [Allosphingosinicella sp.]